jgi:hypothetical protein
MMSGLAEYRQTGVEEPMRQIAANAGSKDPIVVER